MPRLHPEWTTFVAENPNISHDDDERNPRFLSSPAGSTLANQVTTTDTTIPARDGYRIPVRIYRALETQSPHGLVIFYHSGGFVCGSLETEDVSCRYMALAGPFIVVSVEYRLCPPTSYPTPITDGRDVFKHIVTNIDTFVPESQSTDPVKIVLSGTSAGGQIAAIISQEERSLSYDKKHNTANGKVCLSGVLLRAPVTVNASKRALIPPGFREMHHSWCAELETTRLDIQNMQENHDSLKASEEEQTTPSAYPLWGNMDGLPKTYIQICGVDILRDDAVCYAHALEEAGVEVRRTFYEDLPHIFWIYGHELDVSRRAQEDCADGLRWLMDCDSD